MTGPAKPVDPARVRHLRAPSEPASAVQKVVRKISGAEMISPVDARAKLIKELTESVLAAYSGAAELRAHGNAEEAKAIECRAVRLLDMAVEIAEEIAAL